MKKQTIQEKLLGKNIIEGFLPRIEWKSVNWTFNGLNILRLSELGYTMICIEGAGHYTIGEVLDIVHG